MESPIEYRYERLSNDNIHHLVSLFKWVFDKKVSLSFIKDKYNTDYLGKSYLGHIAFDGSRPVAFGGFIPYRIQYNEIIEIGAQSVDSMSLKELSGKGVFKHIFGLNEELLKAEGIAFGYGFGNQDSVPVFVNKFGWSTDQKMAVCMIPTNGLPTSKILSKLGFSKMDNGRLGNILKEYISKRDMINPFDLYGHGYVPYDQDLINYKSGNRRFLIEIDGVLVWIKIDNRLSVGQIEDCDKERFLNVVEKLVSLAQKIGLNEVFLQYSPNSMQANFLNTKYTLIEGSPICFKLICGSHIPLNKILFSNADLDTF